VGSITGEAVIEAPIEALKQEFPQVEQTITQVEPKTAPATESIPAATFKSKLIAAIERTVEARSKPVLQVEPKLTLNSVQATEAVLAETFKSKLIVPIERTVESRLKQALPIEPKLMAKKALIVKPRATTFEPDLVINTATSAERKIESEQAIEIKSEIKLPKKVAVEVELTPLGRVKSTIKFKRKFKKTASSTTVLKKLQKKKTLLFVSNSNKKRSFFL
jgi:hypothetical protein